MPVDISEVVVTLRRAADKAHHGILARREHHVSLCPWRFGVTVAVTAFSIASISGCSGGSPRSDGAPASASNSSPSESGATSTPTTSVDPAAALTTSVSQAVHQGERGDSAAGPVPSSLSGEQVDVANRAVQLVFACDGGQSFVLTPWAGGAAMDARSLVCDGGVSSVNFDAAPRDQVSFRTNLGRTGHFAYTWFVEDVAE